MFRAHCISLICVLVGISGGSANSQEAPPSVANDTQIQDCQSLETQPQLFAGMGLHRRTITTDSTEAQKYFNQGLTWIYAFNHDEATRQLAILKMEGYTNKEAANRLNCSQTTIERRLRLIRKTWSP